MNDTEFSGQIIRALKDRFRFKAGNDKWLQQGECPDCQQWQAYCAAENPKVVKCGRTNKCGWEESVRDLLPDLFEDWSKRFQPTETDPNAAADAYLRSARGLDLTGLRGSFTQEYYHDKDRDIGSATVRFDLPNGSWWERIIDRPGRFKDKARFKFGASYGGYWWQHPADSMADLASLDEIWLAEGIFDAAMLRQEFPAGDPRTGTPRRSAVSNMSTGNYPQHSLNALLAAIDAAQIAKRPRLVFAYDVGASGVNSSKKHVARARADGWDATAAQVRPDGEGAKLDWNDLGLRHQQWRGDPDKAPLGPKQLDEYLWNGAVTIAATAREKARLIQKRRGLMAFDMRFENRIFWVKTIFDKETDQTDLQLDEIANCAFRILYRERDEAEDQTHYFIQIDFPNNTPTAKARFSHAVCTASAEFKKRLFAFAGMWSGNQDQLDRLMRSQTRSMKTVEPLHFTGYSAPHKAWVLGDIAVRDGRLIEINSESYFDFGKQAVKLGTTERLLNITYDPDHLDLSWVQDVWTAWGPRGLVIVAFFTMSLFAQQIRDRQQTLAFLEITGPPGSGKSTLVEFCWRLLGRNKYEGFNPSAGSSASGITRNFLKVANLPVGLIEGNREKDGNSKRAQFDWNELLMLYGGKSPRALGRKNGGTETFEPPFLGSIYLMQNERIDAMDAVLERLMSFHIDKANHTDLTMAAAGRIEHFPVDRASGYIIHVLRNADAWLKFYFERSHYHREQGNMAKRVSGLTNGRIILNHSQLAAAVETLAHLLPVKPEWIAETVRLVDWMALDRQKSSGADHPLVQKFWEHIEYLESLEEDGATRPINLHRKPDQLIAINLPHYEDRCRSRGLPSVPTDQLHKLLSGSKVRKFVEKKPVNCADDRVRHCWVFQHPAGTGTAADVV